MNKKRKRLKHRNTREAGVIRNPIAKHAHKSNRCVVFRDKTKYDRKATKKSFEPFPIEIFAVSMGNGLTNLYGVAGLIPLVLFIHRLLL